MTAIPAAQAITPLLVSAYRLRSVSRTPSHVAGMILTSSLIALAVFWRVSRALRFHVRFA